MCQRGTFHSRSRSIFGWRFVRLFEHACLRLSGYFFLLPYLPYQMCCQILRDEVIDELDASDGALVPLSLLLCEGNQCEAYNMILQRNIVIVSEEGIAKSADMEFLAKHMKRMRTAPCKDLTKPIRLSLSSAYALPRDKA